MDFESPDVMKDFPGLYASNLYKARNDQDYSEDADKVTKKDVLIGKRKDKRDKDRGYAALEGESSAEESYEVRSPTKSKKSKSFKFATKSKEKREKSREKEVADKKKDKDKRSEKKLEKSKVDRKEKKTKYEEWNGIADALPLFGVSLKLAIERNRCHDGIDLPLIVRTCITYIEKAGLAVEYIYKINAPKSKVAHLKKMYNHREDVKPSEYDIPTITSLLKLFLRDMSEPVFTSDLLIRFEEAGAILNVALREKHLKILVGNLPVYNKLLLSWIIVHLYNVTLNEKYNKMNAQSVAMCLSSTLQTSHRLLTALLCHCPALFPDTVLEPYVEPLTSSARLPDDPELMEKELLKQESLLAQIHAEMNAGFFSKQREELLWETQRIITQLKRKLKTAVKEATTLEKPCDKNVTESEKKIENENEPSLEVDSCSSVVQEAERTNDKIEPNVEVNEANASDASSVISVEKSFVKDNEKCEGECEEALAEIKNQFEYEDLEKTVHTMQIKNSLLDDLKQSLIKQIETEKNEICLLRKQLPPKSTEPLVHVDNCSSGSLEEIMYLLQKENQILQIKKINLVRQIMEHEEACIDLKSGAWSVSKTSVK